MVRAFDRANPGSESVHVDTHELYALIRSLKDVDVDVKKRLVRALKESAADALADARAEVLKPSPPKVGRPQYGVKVSRNKDGSRRVRRVVKSFDEREGGRLRHTGLRQHIANSMSVQVANSSAKESTTIKLIAAAKKMPTSQAPMVKAYNKERPFRHPVFADPKRPSDQWGWAYQQGRPYFGHIFGQHRERMLRNIATVMDEYLNHL